MDEKYAGLENRLDVRAGDLIVMQTSSGDKVSGFVLDHNTRKILLSHESPENAFMTKYADFSFGKGNRSYSLRYFITYKRLGIAPEILEVRHTEK